MWTGAERWTQLWVRSTEECVQWKKVESIETLGGVVPSLPPPTLYFHQLGNRWKDLLAKNAEKRGWGAKIYWMESKACLFIWGRSGSNFFSLIADKRALRLRLASFTWLSYAILAFGMFVYEACEMDSVRLCGGRWWGYRRMWDEVGKWEQAMRLAVFCMCAVCDCCRMLSILLLFTLQVPSEMNRWDGINTRLMCPAVAKVDFCELYPSMALNNDVLKKQIRREQKVLECKAVRNSTFQTSMTPSVLLNCSDQ